MNIPHVSPRLGKKAFTLIELLTVIAIIGILAAIIIPTVGKVRETARNSQSLSNIRQIALTNHLFAQDNKDVSVPGKGKHPNNATQNVQWQVLLSPYTEMKVLQGDWEINQDETGYKQKSFFVEPKWNTSAPGWNAGVNQSGYGLNMLPIYPTDGSSNMDWSWNTNSKSRVKLSRVSDASRRILVAVWPQWNLYPNANVAETLLVNAANRYSHGKVNVAYFDGSAGSLSPQDFATRIMTPMP